MHVVLHRTAWPHGRTRAIIRTLRKRVRCTCRSHLSLLICARGRPFCHVCTFYKTQHGCAQDPNVEDPLNKEAAQMLSKDPSKFARLVRQSILEGVTIEGTRFPPCQHQPGKAR